MVESINFLHKISLFHEEQPRASYANIHAHTRVRKASNLQYVLQLCALSLSQSLSLCGFPPHPGCLDTKE